ncbi:hypothetical protein CsatB_027414 [Cannabis sativa]
MKEKPNFYALGVEALMAERPNWLCRKRHKIPNQQGCSNLNDDILLEILLRLPDFKCIVECAYVCKRWFSIISHSKAYFSRRFNYYHRHKRLSNSSQSSSPSLPFTLLFTHSYLPEFNLSMEYFSERSKILDYGQIPALQFLLSSKNRAYIWSSFEDLLLVELFPGQRFCICNPFTRQLVVLPKPPDPFHEYEYSRSFYLQRRYALVVSDYSKTQYKVVKISMGTVDSISIPPHLLHLTIFSSETGQWSHSTLNFPEMLTIFNESEDRTAIVGSNGVIYWPYGLRKTEGIVAFALDVCSKQHRLIGLPKELGRYSNSRVHVGVVRGRVRVAQFYWCKKKQLFVFKAWELFDDGEMCSWNLVHHHDEMMMKFECCISSSSLLAIHALHPDDGDVFFFSHSNKFAKAKEEIKIFQCKILSQNENRIETLVHIPPKISLAKLRVNPIIHPWWPTQIFPLNHPSPSST